MISNEEKLKSLKERLSYYEEKLGFKMKRYRGVIHESAASEMKHQEVMVLRAMVADLKREIAQMEQLILSSVRPTNDQSGKGR